VKTDHETVADHGSRLFVHLPWCHTFLMPGNLSLPQLDSVHFVARDLLEIV